VRGIRAATEVRHVVREVRADLEQQRNCNSRDRDEEVEATLGEGNGSTNDDRRECRWQRFGPGSQHPRVEGGTRRWSDNVCHTAMVPAPQDG
jgi:hypothetical protein